MLGRGHCSSCQLQSFYHFHFFQRSSGVSQNAPGEDEGLPVHDRRILWCGVLGLQKGAAMATGDVGHCLERSRVGEERQQTTARVGCRSPVSQAHATGTRQAHRFCPLTLEPAPHSTQVQHTTTLRCVPLGELTTPDSYDDTTIRCMCL